MIEPFLTALVFGLLPVTWASTGILVVYAYQRPRIGALTERAVIAFVISVLITSGALLVLNTALDLALFDIEVARIVYRVSLLCVGLVPLAWLILFLTRRLGGVDTQTDTLVAACHERKIYSVTDLEDALGEQP